MRNKLFAAMTFLAFVASPTVTIAQPVSQIKEPGSEAKITQNIKSAIDTYRLPTKDEVVNAQIAENLKKIEEERIAAEAAAEAEKAKVAEAARAAEASKVRVVTTKAVTYSADNSDAIEYGHTRNAAVFGEVHWPALFTLWSYESGWRDTAINSSSGACGIPQFINGCVVGDHVSQIDRGLVYIASRYGNPTNALAFWQAHHWY